MKAISVVIITYNSEKTIGACLDSVFSQDRSDYEVLVVDNASSDQTAAIIENGYPQARLIKNTNNFGPAKARNQAMALASGEFILCLDHDTVLTRNCLTQTLKTAQLDEDIGAIGPKVLSEDKPAIYSKGIYVSFLWRFYDLGSGRADSPEADCAKEVFGVSAACAIYRRQALESVKELGQYFDEDFFYFFEDVDLSWRMQRKKWRILYDPQALVFHKGGRSRNNDKTSRYLCLRNRYLVLIKNASAASLLKFPLVFLAYDLWRIIFMLFTNPKYLLRALSDTIRLFPKMLSKRKESYQ